MDEVEMDRKIKNTFRLILWVFVTLGAGIGICIAYFFFLS